MEDAEVKQESNTQQAVMLEEIPMIGKPGLLWIIAFCGLGIVLFSIPIGLLLAMTFGPGNRTEWSPDVAKSNTTVAQVFGSLLFIGALLEGGIQRVVGAIEELRAKGNS